MKFYRRRAFLLAVLGGVLLAFGMFLGVEAAEKSIGDSPVLLVAHRAGAGSAPENTVAALEQAIKDGAVMAEIDVQQLGDGTLIVMHDSNFLRTAGVDINVWDTDYEEVKQFDAGSSFSGGYAGERVPTLEEMLLSADNRICLMIELKYTGHEENLEPAVLALLKKYRMERKCIIGSMNAAILERVKIMDSQADTVLIAHTLSEEQYDLEYVDSYSIEAENMTGEMVDRLHAQDKAVYGWTANRKEKMEYILNCGADGIITDRVNYGKTFLYFRNLRKTICHW